MSTKQTDSVHPTEPSKSMTPSGTATKTKIPGRDLVPPTGKHTEGSVSEYSYWVGVVTECPVEGIDMAGINFPKMTVKNIKDPMRTGHPQRLPQIGAVVRLTEDRIKMMRERLPLTVIRFTTPAEDKAADPHAEKDLGNISDERRKGKLIRIRTDADIATRRKAGRATRHYTKQKNDEPVARYMFALLCEDQENPSRGRFYPDVLEKTGLEWPDDL